jgi:hypothetical protein
MRRRFYAMSLYRLWVEVFGLLDDGTAAELTRKAERIEADYRDPMETIAGKMSQVRDMLERADSGRRNQQTQQEILEQLDDLIALLEEREQPPPGGDDDARRARLPPGAEASGPARVSELPRDTSVRRRPAKAKIHPSGLSDAWGLLPAGEREKLLESFSEGLPERYRQMIREYFMRLAKQRDPRPTTAPGAGRR